jgi:hypothetical protein
MNPLVAALLLVSAEVASLLTTGSLTAGARLVGGALGPTDPWTLALAGAAELVVATRERSRELTPEEYAWAGRVFAGTLPPRERLRLTDTIGADERPFTFPRLDGTITLNMGPAGFADPRRYGVTREGMVRGESFVHELAHAWQAHRGLDVALLTGGLACRLRELVGDNPYTYEPGQPFAEYTLEQQAQIVSDWFRRHHRGLRSPAARRDPRYRYIDADVRRGRPRP